MPIKVLIKRRFKEGYFNEINNVKGIYPLKLCGTMKIHFELW
jgi:hypothetical protein